jgi:uncharacterized membrane protein
MAGGAAPPPPQGAPPPQYAQPVSAAGLTDNVASALCYLGGFITGVLFLVLAPYNQNKAVRFHAFQSIFLNVAAIFLSIALSIVIGMLSFLGALFGLFLGPVIWLGFLALWLYMMFSAYQGKTVVLPIIGELAQKQA